MNNLTQFERDLLSQSTPISRRNTMNLGTEISAEMFVIVKEKEIEKENISAEHSQSSDDVNVGEAAPLRLASPVASLQGVREKEGERRYGRKIGKDDIIVDMTCAIANIRQGARYHRMNAYFSIKTDTDVRYMIFMRSSLTTAHDETIRSCMKHDNLPLRDIALDYIGKHNHLFLGRVKYKPIKGRVTEQHRANLKHALLAMWSEDDKFYGEFYLNGVFYPLEFSSDDLTPQQKKSGYETIAHYKVDEDEME